jgi:uncharacterized membrane protein YfcA
MLLVGLTLAVVIGLSLGLLGGGGSVLTVPVLVYVVGVAAKPAIAMSLPVVGITSLVGASMHWRFGNVQLRTAVLFGGVAMVGAYIGARLAGLLAAPVQLALLAVSMLAAAVPMFRAPRAGRGESTGEAAMSPMIVPAALVVGLLTGLVGIGGGFLVVPALVLLARVPMREAVGTSLVIIAMNSVSGFAGYIGTVSIDWGVLASFTACAIGGAFGGVAMSRRVPQAALKRGFAVFLIVTSSFVLYKNRAVFGVRSPSANRVAVTDSR